MEQKSLVDAFLGKTLEYLNSTEAFLQKNVPAYVEELLQFDFYEALFYTAVPVVVLLIFSAITFACFKVCQNMNNSRDLRELYNVVEAISLVAALITLIVAAFAVPENLMTAVKIKTAPRVYLVDKITSQLKTTK